MFIFVDLRYINVVYVYHSAVGCMDMQINNVGIKYSHMANCNAVSVMPWLESQYLYCICNEPIVKLHVRDMKSTEMFLHPEFWMEHSEL